MKKVYLAGPINGCTDDKCVTWRQWFIAQPVECEFIDPMTRDYRGREADDYREIVELDKRDIRNSDAIAVMFAQPSVGTSMEILFAWELGIPVVLINESEKTLSPWLRYHCTAIVKSKEESLRKLKIWLAD